MYPISRTDWAYAFARYALDELKQPGGVHEYIDWAYELWDTLEYVRERQPQEVAREMCQD